MSWLLAVAFKVVHFMVVSEIINLLVAPPLAPVVVATYGKPGRYANAAAALAAAAAVARAAATTHTNFASGLRSFTLLLAHLD